MHAFRSNKQKCQGAGLNEPPPLTGRIKTLGLQTLSSRKVFDLSKFWLAFPTWGSGKKSYKHKKYSERKIKKFEDMINMVMVKGVYQGFLLPNG